MYTPPCSDTLMQALHRLRVAEQPHELLDEFHYDLGSLILAGNPLTPQGAELLLQGIIACPRGSPLEFVDLRGTYVDDAGVQSLQVTAP